jgi:predicted metal-binding membrane protein
METAARDVGRTSDHTSPDSDITVVEQLMRRDRLIVATALAVVSLLSWLYLLRMAAAMHAAADEAAMHAAMGMSMNISPWSASNVVSLFLMWAVMMAGMMLPSAAPIILLVLGVYRRRGGPQARLSTFAFGTGYLAGCQNASMLSPAMSTRSGAVAGGALVIAGVYQWLPIKNACLAHCRSPLRYLSEEWREGSLGRF